MNKKVIISSVLLLLVLAGGIAVYNWVPLGVNDAEEITIRVSQKAYKKIRKKRNKALDQGILLTDSDDYVEAEFLTEDQSFKADIRLKGDWTDHLKDDKKWSFRVKLERDGRFHGMRKFSLQSPKARNFMHEWFFHKLQKKLGLISLRYGFVNLKLDVDGDEIDLGVYNFEEAFHKLLVENNGRREGVLMKFDEDELWEQRQNYYHLGQALKENKPYYSIYKVTPISCFSENSVLKSPALKAQYQQAKDLMTAFRKGELKAEQVFDMEKIGAHVALANFTGGGHSLIWHNLRYYFNPVSGLLEPVVFGVEGGRKISYLVHYHLFHRNAVFQKYHAKYLELLTTKGFLESFMEEVDSDLNKQLKVIQSEFRDVEFDAGIYRKNRNFIKPYLNYNQMLRADLNEFDGETFELNIENVYAFALEIEEIQFSKKTVATCVNKQVLAPYGIGKYRFKLQQDSIKVFGKNRDREFVLAKDHKELKIKYRISGTSESQTDQIHPLTMYDSTIFDREIFSTYSDLSAFEFIHVNEQDKKIVFQAGYWNLGKNLVIPAGYQVIIPTRFQLNLINKAKIISYSPIQANGGPKSPITILSNDGTGQGIAVMNASATDTSRLNYVRFIGLSNPRQRGWSLTGSVNFYLSNVQLNNVLFTNNTSEDALNVISSDVKMTNCSYYNIKSDAFDGDFVTGSIEGCTFDNLGNDAIDVSGSGIELNRIVIERASDKGISAGEKSKITGRNILVDSSAIAITSKDHSTITLDSLTITNCDVGFTAFQKKPEFGPAEIQVSNLTVSQVKLDHLIETNSKAMINDQAASTSDQVVDRLYGVEFGKKTKKF